MQQAGGYSSYVMANDQVPRQLETFRDSLALQFPAKPTDGTVKPHFFRGSVSAPVNLWVWEPDTEGGGVVEAVARGWKQEYKPEADDEQQVVGRSVWSEGRWHVVMTRPLTTADKNDVQFVTGQFIPMSVNVWDGSNGEHGLLMSLSSWYFVVLEGSIPVSVYIYALIAGVITLFAGIYLRGLAVNGRPTTPYGEET